MPTLFSHITKMRYVDFRVIRFYNGTNIIQAVLYEFFGIRRMRTVQSIQTSFCLSNYMGRSLRTIIRRSCGKEIE